MEWLRKILGFCVHQYEIIEEVKIVNAGLTHRKVYVLKCKYCGKMQNHIVDAFDF